MAKILLVDDDPDIRMVARMTLKRKGGHEVEACDGGASALEKLKSWRPDLIVLDVMMPNMTGHQTLKAIRAQPELQGVPVVFLTAKAQRQEIEEGLKLGAAGYLTKPFEPAELVTEIAKFLPK
jgi:CheY-like chemotaxis protein